MYQIDYNSYRSVKSFNRRVRFLVMHYTSINFKDSIIALTGSAVSAHYLVPDPSEKTYVEAGFKDMRIFNLVDENERAWHAGVSSWAGRSNLNDTSIGIEIVNLATGHTDSFKETYLEAGFKDKHDFNPVDKNESKRFGVHLLSENSDLNDKAVELGSVDLVTYNNDAFTFPPYNPIQIEAVKELALNVLQRYPDIMSTDV
ncbi:N-acetylmuramoyl-L-alanine amidase, partial [Bartonella bovis]|uniref:N-acetylmuramoyl-L-alanine amidase n=1 Tax=Bartonella bovis TaxID=155194 RepID=UPI001ABADAAB